MIKKFFLWVMAFFWGMKCFEEEEPPVPPENNWPDWVKRFGDLDRYEPVYLYNNIKAFYKVMSEKAPVFFASPGQSFAVERPDGSYAEKHVFEARETPDQPMLAVKQGLTIVGYKDWIPATIRKHEKAYSNGGPAIEICDPKYGVIRPDDVVMVGWINEDGVYLEADYIGV